MSEQLANSHLHRCQGCGAVWGHGNMMEADIQAHKCPKCGKQEWRVYQGGGRPQVARMPAPGKPKTDWLSISIAALLLVSLALTVARLTVALVKEARP